MTGMRSGTLRCVCFVCGMYIKKAQEVLKMYTVVKTSLQVDKEGNVLFNNSL